MNTLSVLIISCDKYEEVWPVFFKLFFKYWPDCPYKIYLLSNFKDYEDSRINVIKIGGDISWGSNLKIALGKIPNEYVLTLLEDFLILKPIDTKKIEKHLEYIQRLNGHYLRLRDNPKPDKPIDSIPEIGEISPGQNWRVAMQPAIWKRSFLMELVRADETAWDMEIKGSVRSNAILSGFYSSYNCLIYFNNGIESGNWLRYNLAAAKKEGIILPVRNFPVMTRWKHILRYSNNKSNSFIFNPLRSILINHFPGIVKTLKKIKTKV